MSSEYMRKYDLDPDEWRGAFGRSLERCRQEKVDVFIGNHANQNNTLERLEKLAAGDKNAFVEPEAWERFLDNCQASLAKLNESDPL